MTRLTAAILLAFAVIPAHAATTALHCERLFDSRSGRMLDTRTIVVRDGRVAEVLPGRVPVADAQAIDLSGHTCTPGWTDRDVHPGSRSSPQSYSEGFRLDDIDFAFRAVGYAAKTLQAGFTSVRDLGGEVAPHLHDAFKLGQRADIVAMPGDTLADIRNVLKVDLVMKDGVVHRTPAP